MARETKKTEGGKMIKKMRYNNVTIGYEVIKEDKVVYTIMQSDNRSWNLYENANILTGWADSFNTLKEAKAAALLC